MNVPMGLTLSRLATAPVFLAAFFLPDWAPDWLADRRQAVIAARVLVLVLAVWVEISDILDGLLARRWNQVSEAGKFLDPLADSVTRSTVFLSFLAVHWIPVWMVALIFWRESTISGLRIAGAAQQVIISARLSGKLKAILQGIVINVVLAADLWLLMRDGPMAVRPAWFGELTWWSMLAVTIVTVASLGDYFAGNMAVLRRLFTTQSAPVAKA